MVIQTRAARGRPAARGDAVLWTICFEHRGRSRVLAGGGVCRTVYITHRGSSRGPTIEHTPGTGTGGAHGGGIQRATSFPRTGSGENAVSEAVAELRQRLDDMQDELANRAGANLQWQAEIDDLRMHRPGGDEMGGTADTDDAELVITNMAV